MKVLNYMTNKKLISKRPIGRALIFLALATMAMASCAKPSDVPSFVNSQEGPEDGPIADPNLVNDRLALDRGLEKIVYHVGPVELTAGLRAEEMAEKPLVMHFQLEKSAWAVAFSPRVVDSKGRPLPGELLQMAIVSNLHEENPFCAEAAAGNPFMATNSLLASVSLPDGYGYPILASDPLQARVVLKNPTETSYTDVFFEITLAVLPMGEFTSLRDVSPYYVELSPCDHKPASIAPAEFFEIEASYQVPRSADVVAVQGFIGDFGATLDLFAKGAQNPFFSAVANLDEESKITSLYQGDFGEGGAYALKAGDELTLRATYDNRSKGWIHSAESAAMLYASPKE